MAVQFSPKILRLNVGNFGSVSDSPKLNFWDYFGQSGTDFFGLFWTVWDKILELFSDSLELKLRDCFEQSWDRLLDCY